METTMQLSDRTVLDLLRRAGPMNIQQLTEALSVTKTAVRQRLDRLMAQEMVTRSVERTGRGRPGHRYALTEKAIRQTGSNFADLAVTLWQEIRAIRHEDVRRGLLQRLAARMTDFYAHAISGSTLEQRMRSLAQLLSTRDIPFDVEVTDGQLPVLRALGCPYTELAEKDRTICSMERMLFSNLIGEDLRLDACRLDGASCCRFEPSAKSA